MVASVISASFCVENSNSIPDSTLSYSMRDLFYVLPMNDIYGIIRICNRSSSPSPMLTPHCLLESGPLTEDLLALTGRRGFPLLEALPNARCDDITLPVVAIGPFNAAMDAVQRVAKKAP